MKTEVVDLLSDSSSDEDEVEVLSTSKKKAAPSKKKQSSASSLRATAAMMRLEQQTRGVENPSSMVKRENNSNAFASFEEEDSSAMLARDPYGPLKDGETTTVQGSKPEVHYTIKRTGHTYYCTCPAWKFQQTAPAAGRTCKHINALRAAYADNHVGGRHSSSAKAAGKKKRATGSKANNKKAKKTADENKDDRIDVALAEKWNPDKHNPTKYYMSEKLDGMRCVWDGKGALWSRNGNMIHAPGAFANALPRGVCLDGELWLGRQQFQDLMSIVNSGATAPGWSRVQYVVFDAPQTTSDFPTRLAAIGRALATARTPARIAHLLPQTVCTGAAHARAELDAVVARGGEGVMLRHPQAPYRAGRTRHLLKVKRALDAEARVVGHEEGKGKHRGRLGALRCTMIEEGRAFKLGTGFTDAQRENPPAVGAIVTYKYQELTKGGLPRFPVFDRVRPEE